MGRRDTSRARSRGRRADPVGAWLARAGRPVEGLTRYFDLSQRPLQILIFLLPLVVLYGLGTWRYGLRAADGQPITISAYKMLMDFFEVFGVGGLYLPGFALVTVLLVWHLLKRDRWEWHPGVPAVMFIESLLLAVPLLVIGGLLAAMSDAAVLDIGLGQTAALSPPHPLTSSPPHTLADLPWQTRLVLAVGAGLYEELVFRMILIAAAHFVLVDVLGVKPNRGAAIALLLSAVAFTMYHDLSPAGRLDLQRVAFYFLSGLYFAALYVVRGFGIVVGTHAVYDILVIVVFPTLVGEA